MIKRSLLIWLLIAPLAILNGGLRDKVINPLMGAEYGLPLSGILLCTMIFALCYMSIGWVGKGTSKAYLTIGLLWMALTVLFEFCLGLLMQNSVSELIKAYDITTGNLWLVVVLFTGAAPWLAAKMKKIV